VWDGYVNLTPQVGQQISYRPKIKKPGRDIFISGPASVFHGL
jgi:hypothetical protein